MNATAASVVSLGLTGLFDDRVRVATCPTVGEPCLLFPEEETCVARAIERRRREFAAGRRLARSLLAEWGRAEMPIPSSPDRTPIWPEDHVGSIAHAAGLCAAAVALQKDFASIGIDVEPEAPLETELWPIIAGGNEREWLERTSKDRRGVFARLLFCAKEAVYKAWFVLTRAPLEFHGVMVTFSEGLGRFDATICPTHPLAKARASAIMEGRFLVRGGWIFTGVAVPNDLRFSFSNPN